MAVARILTRSPEDAGPLAGGLRARGYTVEIVAPDAAPRGAVELEITLDPCATADALRRAAEIAQPGGLDVFVSPATFADARIAAVPRLEAPALVTSGPAKTPQSERGRELRAVTGLAAAAVANLLGRVRELIMLAVASIGEFVHRTSARIAVRRRQRGQAECTSCSARLRRP